MQKTIRSILYSALVFGAYACDSSGDDCPDGEICVDGGMMIILPAGGAGGGAGGVGGGAGGQGGGEGGAGGGAGGQGGGAGGQGGEGGGAGGEGGEGGEGGGCTPMCAGRACGPDGCGGECGPGCAGGEVCSDGQCILGECPGGTFECGGVCADLLNDADNCGSCGKRCADEWPQAWTDAGFTFEGANIEAVCQQAECGFQCAASDTPPEALIEDVNNCGACGNVCESGAVNSVQDACVAAQCFCVLTPDGEQGLLGNTCGDRCTLAGANCGDGCCPIMAPGVVPIPQEPSGDAQYSYRVDLNRPAGIDIQLEGECDRIGIQLVRYEDNGLVPFILRGGCEGVRFPILPAGHYGVVVIPDRDDDHRVRFASGPLEPLFDAPGRSETRRAVANAVDFPFRVVEAGTYRIRLTEFENQGNCDGQGGIYLLDAQGEVAHVLHEERNCVFDLGGGDTVNLAAGVYAVFATAERLSGGHFISVDQLDVEPDPGVPAGAISEPGTYPFDGFGQNGSDTLTLFFPEGGRYSLTTANRNGAGCPGDTILTINQGGQAVAQNDDAAGVPDNCSQLAFEFEAGVLYEAVISGFDNRAIGNGALVVRE